MKIFLFALASVALSGCATIFPGLAKEKSINTYKSISPTIHLKQSKDEVLSILQPIQDMLPVQDRKPSESFFRGEDLVEVVFIRSANISDNLITDDEFTPYVFTNGVLTSIGWTAIGGPKTQGQQKLEKIRHYQPAVVTQ